MNEEGLLLLVWVKFLSDKYELHGRSSYSMTKNKKKFLFFDLIYDEEFIFKFTCFHFHFSFDKVIPNIDDVQEFFSSGNLNFSSYEKGEIVLKIIITALNDLSYTLSEKIIKEIKSGVFEQNKDKDKEASLLLWKVIFTITYMHEFDVKDFQIDEHLTGNKEEDCNRSNLQIYNIYHMYKEDEKKILKNLRKSPLLFKFMIKIVNEVFEQIDFNKGEGITGHLHTYDEIDKLFSEVNKHSKISNLNKTVIEQLDLSKCKSQNLSQFNSPTKVGNIQFINNVSFESHEGGLNNNNLLVSNTFSNSVSPRKIDNTNVYSLNTNTNLISNSEVSTSRSLHTDKLDNFKLSLQSTNTHYRADILYSNKTIPVNNENTDPNQALFEQIISLTTTLYNLEDEKVELISRIENLLEENGKLNSELVRNQGLITCKDERNQDLNNEIYNYKEQVGLLKDKISDLSERVEHLQDQLKEFQDVKNSNSKLKEEIRRKRSEISSIINSHIPNITCKSTNNKCRMQRFSFTIESGFIKDFNQKDNNVTSFYTDLLEMKSKIIKNKNIEIISFSQKNLELRMIIKKREMKIEELKEENEELTKNLSIQEKKLSKYRKQLSKVIKENEESSSNFTKWIYISTILSIVLCVIIFMFLKTSL